MTIGTTSDRELTAEKIVLRAYQVAGLQAVEQGIGGPNWTERFSFARDLLDTILDALQAEGVFAKHVALELVELTEGTYIYSLPASVFDVVENGSYIAEGQVVTAAQGETPVQQVDRETWQRLSSKASQSRPTMFWTRRDVSPPQVYLWPTPDEDGTIRFQVHRLLADVTDGTVTIDLERYWTTWLIWELAFQLAEAHSQDDAKCARLATMAAEKKRLAKAQANQGVPSQIWLSHRTGWQ